MPPKLFFARQFQMPVRSMTHSPCEAKASPFLIPSVIHSGIPGSASCFRHDGGQSSRLVAPVGVSYLIGLPLLLSLGLSGRNW